MKDCKDCYAAGGMCELHESDMPLSERAMAKRSKYASGGSVEMVDDLADDFKDTDDISDPEHDAGAVDEEPDMSLAGMALRKRKGKK